MKNITLIKYHLNKKGGLEKYFFSFLDYLIKNNYFITIITSDASILESSKNIKIVTLKLKKTLKFLKLKEFDLLLNDYLKNNKIGKVFSFDRVSFHNYTRLGNGVHLSFLNKRKLTESFFKTFLNKINPLHKTILDIERKSLKFVHLKKIIVNSNMVKNELINYYQVDSKKIQVIHNGVEIKNNEEDFLSSFKNPNNCYEKTSLNPNNYNLLFIANDFKRKGLLPLLKAIYLLKEKNIFLSIVGSDKKIDKYKKLIKKLNIENKVKFFGSLNNVNDFYKCCTIFILPTIYDPFSNVAIEALSYGLFTITTEHNGACEVIDKKNGYILKNAVDIYEIKKSISLAMQYKKNLENATKIRNSILHLDFSNQLNKLLNVINE
ncbi:MAG: Lipopolysaccharide core biosynthesis protein RfaG [Candidatus Anoxychlamydiales bacterium]|nr:Lipopolysaccharide core biosynthesis protein RfaG [Candidatus Anoxychlamydiales bacterium]